MALKVRFWIFAFFVLTVLLNFSFVNAVLPSWVEDTLPYWIEDTNGDGVADYVWVKVNLTAGENYLYYDLVSGYNPDGDKVFEFFDDFEGTSINTSKWSHTAFVFIGSGEVMIHSSDQMISKIGVSADNVIFEAKVKNPGRNMKSNFMTIDSSSSSYSNANNIFFNDMNDVNYGISWNTLKDGSWEQEKILTSDYNTGYYIFSLYSSNDSFFGKVFDLSYNNIVSSDIRLRNSLTTLYVLLKTYNVVGTGTYFYVDWVRARKYTPTEPTIFTTTGNAIVINSATDLTDYQVKIPASSLGITSLNESILFSYSFFELTNRKVKELTNETISYFIENSQYLNDATGYAIIQDLTRNHTVNLTFNGTHLVANESHIWDLVNKSKVDLSSYDTRTIYVNATLFWNDGTNQTIERNDTKKIYQRFNVSNIKYKAYYTEDQDGIFNITYSFSLTDPNLPYLTDYDLVYISYNDTELSTTTTADIPQNSLARKIGSTYYYVPRPDGTPEINITKTTTYGGNNYYEATLQINFSNKQANLLPNTYYITINPSFNITYNNFTINRYFEDEIIITTPDLKESDFYSKTYYYNGQTYNSSSSSLGTLWSDLLINYYLFDWNQIQIKATFKPEESSASGMDTLSYDFWLSYDFNEKTNDKAYAYFDDSISYNYSITGGSATPNTQIDLFNEKRLFDEFTADWSYIKYYAYQSSATENKSYVRFYYLPPTCLNMSQSINFNLYYIGNENTLEPVNLVRLNIYIKDGSTQNPVPDAIVKVLKETSPGTYTLVEQVKTDTEGKATALVQAYDYNYKFIVEKDCKVLYTTSPTTISTSDIIIYVSQEGGDVPLTQYYKDYMSSIAYNFNYDPETQVLTVTYSDTSGISRQHCFDLQYINIDGEYETSSYDCFTEASITKEYNLSGSVYEKWRVKYSIDGNLVETYAFDKGVYDRLKENYNPFAVFTFILIFAIISVVFGMMELFFFAVPLVLYISYYFGFLNMSLTFLLTITLLSWLFAIASLFKKEGLG